MTTNELKQAISIVISCARHADGFKLPDGVIDAFSNIICHLGAILDLLNHTPESYRHSEIMYSIMTKLVAYQRECIRGDLLLVHAKETENQ